MATPNPVPSRAAIHALRGVLFTTSCSVVLLAEERRRRIKIARSAIDNARKLHVVRSNRGPTALTEGLGSLESRLTDLGDEVLSMAAITQPANYRRRRRDGQLAESMSSSDVNFQRNPSPSRISEKKPSGNASSTNVTNIETLNFESLKIIPLDSTSGRRAFIWMPPTKETSSNLISVQLDNKPTVPVDLLNDEPLQERKSLKHDVRHSEESNKTKSEAQSEWNSAMQHSTDEALMVLEQLLCDLESRHVDRAGATERLELATAVLQRLASIDRPLPRATKAMRLKGIRLLKNVVEVDITKTTTILAALTPLFSTRILDVLYPFMEWLQETNNQKGVERVFEYFSDRKRAPFWMHGMLAYRILLRHVRSQETFEQAKKFYRLLQRSGLFSRFDVSDATEYKIRRLMILEAIKSGNDDFALAEREILYEREPHASKFDMALQSKLILRDARTGNWDSVRADVEILRNVVDTSSSKFQDMLSSLVDLYARETPADELELLARLWVKDYGLMLKYRWVHLVLDHHASQHQLDPMIAWLQFCCETGVSMDSAFIQRFYTRCRKYWSFSNKSIAHLHSSLQDSMPSATESQGSTQDTGSVSATRGTRKSSAVPARRDRSILAPSNIPLLGESEGQIYRQMNSLASNDDWERVCDMFTQNISNGADMSSRCLRLAVLGHLKKERSEIETATALVQQAHVQGHNVADALPPLMLAQLNDGCDASRLIDETLSLGVRIHDSVYNRAAQTLSARGNQRAAADMCELAARENGNGELLYNEYNFSNLVFAYTGSARYKPLGALLSKFTSEVQWWHGSKTCKESIKLAMKTTAMRSVTAGQDGRHHQQALDELEKALDHVKKCRSTRDDRRAVTEAFVRVVRPSAKTAMRGRPPHGNARTIKVVIDRQQTQQWQSQAWANQVDNSV